MTKEEILALAREAGGTQSLFDHWRMYTSDIERFAALVAAYEREECAKNCEGTGMTGYKIGMAEEAVIADLTAKLAECKAQKEAALRIAEQHSDVVNNMIQQLTESQAREVKLREYIFMISTSPAYPEAIHKWCKEALALLPDDTALKEFKRKVLLEAADWFDKDAGVYGMDSMWSLSGEKLRRMAEE